MKNGEGGVWQNVKGVGWGGGGSGRHDDLNGDDAGKVGGDHVLYFLLTTSWLEINWLAEKQKLLSEKQRRLTAKNEGVQ